MLSVSSTLRRKKNVATSTRDLQYSHRRNVATSTELGDSLSQVDRHGNDGARETSKGFRKDDFAMLLGIHGKYMYIHTCILT